MSTAQHREGVGGTPLLGITPAQLPSATGPDLAAREAEIVVSPGRLIFEDSVDITGGARGGTFGSFHHNMVVVKFPNRH